MYLWNSEWSSEECSPQSEWRHDTVHVPWVEPDEHVFFASPHPTCVLWSWDLDFSPANLVPYNCCWSSCPLSLLPQITRNITCYALTSWMETPASNIPTALLLSSMDIFAMLDVFMMYAVRIKNNMLNCVHLEMKHRILVHDILKVQNCQLRQTIETMHEIHMGTDDRLINDRWWKIQQYISTYLEVT